MRSSGHSVVEPLHEHFNLALVHVCTLSASLASARFFEDVPTMALALCPFRFIETLVVNFTELGLPPRSLG